MLKNNILGTHLLFTLKVKEIETLSNFENFNHFITLLLNKNEVEIVGYSFHIFENESFTAAYCLKESHICVHTWPELNTLTIDVYFCNYRKDNSSKSQYISNEIVNYFDAKITNFNEIER